MRIRNRRVIDKAMKKHAMARKPLEQWLVIAASSQWRSIFDAREVFPTTDAIKGTNLTCFNVGGNSFRLIAIVSYELQIIFVNEVLTHAEYSKRY